MYNSTRAHVRALCLVFVALGAAACDVSVGNGDFSIGLATGKASDQWTRTYQLTPGGRIEVLNVNGRIDVEAADGAAVEVKAERIAKARSDESARELLKKIEILEEAKANSVRIETKAPSRLMGVSHEVRYTLRVPRGAEVIVQTTNGGVTVSGVQGSVRATSTNGGINGKALGGGVEASTTNGGIRMELDAIGSREIKLETVNGGIDLRMPETAKAEISARCLNGGISVSGLNLEDVSERSRRRLDARLNGGGGARIDIETTNGGVRIAGKS